MKILFIDFNNVGVKTIKKIDNTEFDKIYIIGQKKCPVEIFSNSINIGAASHDYSTVSMITFEIGKIIDNISEVIIMTKSNTNVKVYNIIKHICKNLNKIKYEYRLIK